MAGPRHRPGEWERPPPRREAAPPIGHRQRHPKSPSIETESIGPVGSALGPGAAELEPRLGHDPSSCSTCVIAADMDRRWRQRELRALRGGRRVIDLRETEL
jgi:hypothetical protein